MCAPTQRTREDKMTIDRPLHILLAYLAAKNGGARGDLELLERLAADVPGVDHAALTDAARATKELGRELRKFAYRIEQATKGAKPQEALQGLFAGEPPP
jgi:hypothetical protein